MNIKRKCCKIIGVLSALLLSASIVIQVIHIIFAHRTIYGRDTQNKLYSLICQSYKMTSVDRGMKLWSMTKAYVDSLPRSIRQKYVRYASNGKNESLDWDVYDIESLMPEYKGVIEVGMKDSNEECYQVSYEFRGDL